MQRRLAIRALFPTGSHTYTFHRIARLRSDTEAPKWSSRPPERHRLGTAAERQIRRTAPRPVPERPFLIAECCGSLESLGRGADHCAKVAIGRSSFALFLVPSHVSAQDIVKTWRKLVPMSVRVVRNDCRKPATSAPRSSYRFFCGRSIF